MMRFLKTPMPTVITHPAVALAALPILKGIQRKSLVILSGVLLSVLPDLDVLAFKAGIPYGHMFGHRGFSHSILFSFFLSLLFALILKQEKQIRNLIVWAYLFICGASHGLLDAFTNGALGIGLFIPFTSERYFFEYRPIQVSTLSLERFINGQGATVLQNELVNVWIPAVAVFSVLWVLRQGLLRAVKQNGQYLH